MSLSRTGGRSSRASASAAGSKRQASKASAPPAPKQPAPKQAAAKKKPSKSVPRETKPFSLEDDATFKKVRSLALALPDTKLTMTWGSPHFRVGEKIFCGYGRHDGKLVLGVKLALPHAHRLVKQPRFWPAPYVGKHGWVSMDVSQRQSWDEVAGLIRESYELIAPKASRAKLR